MIAPTRSLAKALALAVLGLGSSLLAPTSLLPVADAATCTSAGGVSVVVDYRELGGSTVMACAPDGGGKSASAVFDSVGVTISYATRQPGFVCRVNSVPASDPCVNASPADAYWGLWWSDGTSSSWTFSSSGVGGVVVPPGGSVGWAWQQGRSAGGAVPPAVAPPVNPATPTSSPTTSNPTSSSPTPSPTPTSGSTGGSGSGSGGAQGGGKYGGTGGTSSPTSSPSASPTSPSGSPSSTPSESPMASESPGDSQRSAGPGEAGTTGGKGSGKGSDKGSSKGSKDGESPSDSPSSAGGDPSGSASESPGDLVPSASSEATDPQADSPARVPAALSWGVIGLLAIVIAGGAVLARRRRGV